MDAVADLSTAAVLAAAADGYRQPSTQPLNPHRLPTQPLNPYRLPTQPPVPPADSDDGVDSDDAPRPAGAHPGLGGVLESVGPNRIDLLKAGLEWWRRAMSGGWVEVWVDVCMVEDVRIRDYAVAQPQQVVGKEGVCSYYNALLRTHHPHQLTMGFVSPTTFELLPTGAIAATASVLIDWGWPRTYHMQAEFEFRLRGHLIEDILMWPADAPRPSDPSSDAGTLALDWAFTERWAAEQLAPYRCAMPPPTQAGGEAVSALASGTGDAPEDMPPNLLTSEVRVPAPPPAGEANHPNSGGVLERFARGMVRQFSEAINDVGRSGVEWAARWIALCNTDDVVVVDHTPAPRSLRIVGKKRVQEYWRCILSMCGDAAVNAQRWETRDVRICGTSPHCSATATCDAYWEWGGEEYRIPMLLTARLRGMRICSIELRPRGLAEDAGGRRVGDAVTWDGSPLDPALWRQYLVGGDAVQVSRPCSHNAWDNVRIRRGWIVLRCRECDAKWRQRPQRTHRCADFATEQGCPKGDACPLLHVHHTKLTLRERQGSSGRRDGYSDPTSPGEAASACREP